MQGLYHLKLQTHSNFPNADTPQHIKTRPLPSPQPEEIETFSLDDSWNSNISPTNKKTFKVDKPILVIEYLDCKLRDQF
ncbi:unnamed protein product (macronuclear) [Paramecium tetraurelia]|uniref:Uncharacterized protein n=1 Tax=Paramecium tetraurelia TaxID=5888 RepID=A0BHX3_PARTE|nr:uncharacterized protein GSPATT00029176001 [Paramecium tetraurelia]CAK58140.1 unnamed protein product [Paramecium tetraurelia]|eukprot:XP_001425538.1 hypothetical protein (macronuclear) [Paramecium tetraurelia strain d4-2]